MNTRSSSRFLKQYRHGSLNFTGLATMSYWLNSYPYDPNGYGLPLPAKWRKSHGDFGVANRGILRSNCFLYVERIRHVSDGLELPSWLLSMLLHKVIMNIYIYIYITTQMSSHFTNQHLIHPVPHHPLPYLLYIYQWLSGKLYSSMAVRAEQPKCRTRLSMSTKTSSVIYTWLKTTRAAV